MAREIYGPLMSVKEVAKYLGIGRNRVYEKLKNNEISFIKDRNGHLVAKSILDDYIENLYKKEKMLAETSKSK